MYALVKFYDNIYYVRKSKDIIITKSGIKCKYSDGRTYSASIIVKNDDKTLLKEMLQNIYQNIPYPYCKRIELEDKNGSNYKLNYGNDLQKQLTPKSCETILAALSGDVSIKYERCEISNNYENVNILISYDNNEKTDSSLNENSNNLKTDVQNFLFSMLDIKEETDWSLTVSSNNHKTDMLNSPKKLTCNISEKSLVNSKNKGIHHIYQNNANKIYNDEQDSDVSIFSDINNDKEDSDTEYLPLEDERSSSDSDENNDKFLQKHKSFSTSKSSISSLDNSQINIVGTSALNDEIMHVEKSNAKSIKRNYCFFCMKPQTQFTRHLETVHCNEPEVKQFSVLPKMNKERKKLIGIIRKKGNFKFNTTSEFNDGQLIVCRRPNKKSNKTATDFTACIKCKGFFAKNTIRHHSRNCLQTNFKKNRILMIMGRKIIGRIHKLANRTLRKTVFPVMREDKVTRIIRYDELLIIYANKLCIKYKFEHQHDIIRARLRVLGRFLLSLKEINKDIKDFKSLYQPKMYDDCISAINIVAGYDDEKETYRAPTVVVNLSTLIKHIGNILITEYIKKKNEKKVKLVKDFLKLLVMGVGTNVNKTVIETQSLHKRHKKITLPSLEDIQKLFKYLKKKRTEAYNALKQSFSYDAWILLAEATLTSVLVFNRRRLREIEQILIEDFQNYEKVNKNMNSDIYNSLSEEDRKIAEKYVRFCIRKKSECTVPVLLSNDLHQCIMLILKFRKEAKVLKKNPYVFGLPATNRYRHLRAHVIMRRFAKECNVMHSTNLRDTMLKHITTQYIQINLNDISDFATFTEHADKTHRQPLITRNILKISQYLKAVQENTQDSSDESLSSNKIEHNSDSEKSIINSSEINIISPNTTKYIIQEKRGNSKKRKRFTSPYEKIKRVRWTEEEKDDVFQAFAKHMENLTLPSLKEIQETKKKYRSLSNRTLPQIKTWLYNKQKMLQ